ncbi:MULTISPECIES: hypothetical protein [unclassified Crossiella]|uniref:hypothetical protein n=1 Tax=unclassified Crossiella TaxID=2620835 RepID=UPI001FFEE539|nr:MULTISPECIES: hypothetical protein [unclassified Crossiella]MCK2240653.1 hypothetical protein [Crossiella sp. S99.2]MCK2252896.1 hypothetical protein [Crossiella sp. S99.1]
MDSDDITQALATTLTHSITTALNLAPSKIDPLEDRLYRAIKPLQGQERSPLPSSLVQEARTGRMQAELDDLVAANQPTVDKTATGDLRSWIDVLLGIVGQTYSLSPNSLLFTTGRFAAALRMAGLADSP